MKNAALKKYLEENHGSEELINTITLLEDFTGWEFSVRNFTSNGKSCYALGIESSSAPKSLWVVLKTPIYSVTAAEYFIETFGPYEAILNRLSEWCRDSLLTLNETETSIRMKLEIRGNKRK